MMHLKYKFMQFLFESGEENAFNYNRNALNLYFTFDRYSKIVMDATSLIMKKKYINAFLSIYTIKISIISTLSRMKAFALSISCSIFVALLGVK